VGAALLLRDGFWARERVLRKERSPPSRAGIPERNKPLTRGAFCPAREGHCERSADCRKGRSRTLGPGTGRRQEGVGQQWPTLAHSAYRGDRDVRVPRDTARAMSPENTTTLRGVRYGVSLPRGRGSQRRTLDERLYVRFPRLLSRIGQAWMRLPSSSRLRRSMLTRLIQRGCAAANRRDFDLLMVASIPRSNSSCRKVWLGASCPPTFSASIAATRVTCACGRA
jgi:hypothetical protein